ncbi:hypothetical protein HZH68_004844 [Vespula germanica]|uniref:Uncharacterized protein n=1 Tax=Vespula germanica TaxID=30212 RepID=A0A834NK51_VESGE|nr:hypothetical protein HZH68_004844 [Vespula germanica]
MLISTISMTNAVAATACFADVVSSTVVFLVIELSTTWRSQKRQESTVRIFSGERRCLRALKDVKGIPRSERGVESTRNGRFEKPGFLKFTRRRAPYLLSRGRDFSEAEATATSAAEKDADLWYVALRYGSMKLPETFRLPSSLRERFSFPACPTARHRHFQQ